MKLIIKGIVLISLISVQILCLKLKGSLTEQTNQTGNTLWSNLFTNVTPPAQICNPPVNFHPDDDKEKDNESANRKTPWVKGSKWNKQQGFGASAYLFDFLDDILQKDIYTEFNKVFSDAKGLNPPGATVYSDPYDLNKMIFFHTNGAKGSLTPAKPSDYTELFKEVVKHNKGFNPTVWQNSVNAAQIYTIIKDWGWQSNPHPDFAKKIIDTYDFDGDGRLNPTEFILFSIVNNKKILGGNICKKNCYADVITKKIDPIFSYLDCDSDKFISAENMWAGLDFLKRSNPKNYNMYLCQMPTALNKGYRTTSCNDFILKNYHAADGFVNKEEARIGVLLGYWDRQTDQNKIYNDDTRNLKSLRWGNNGQTDTVCQSILSLMPGGSTPQVTVKTS